MSYEFLDDMFERLLVTEGKTFGEAFEAIINERVEIMRDLGRVENAYQLFRKRHPQLPDNYFRNHIQRTRPADYKLCVKLFHWA